MRVRFSSIALLTIMLQGCGGGGSGMLSGEATIPPTDCAVVGGCFGSRNFFSPDHSIQLNPITQARLYQQGFSYTRLPDGTTTSLNLDGPVIGGLQVEFTGPEEISGIMFSSPTGSLSVDRTNGVLNSYQASNQDGTIRFWEIEADTNDELSFGVLTDPEGFDFSAYGWWSTPTDRSTNIAGFGGVFSTGYETSAAAVPTSGLAVYSGSSVGLFYGAYADEGLFDTQSLVQATANFGQRSISISSFATNAYRIGTNVQESAAGLNFNGTATYSQGSASFAGTARVSEAGWNQGALEGRFYGPNAEELGGTFSFTSSNGKYLGAFGGRR